MNIGGVHKRLRQAGKIQLMIRNKSLRRSLGALLVLLGALLIWLPYDLASGIVLVLAGAALELVGIALEKRDKRS
jgi:drug/metabolite transporter (DMT)-like permease